MPSEQKVLISENKAFHSLDDAVVNFEYTVGVVSVEALFESGVYYDDSIRTNLYSLHFHAKNIRILDIGSLRKGNTYSDTIAGFKTIASFFKSKNIPLIIIGGNNYIANHCLEVYKNIQYKSATLVSNCLDYNDPSDSTNFLTDFLKNDVHVNHLGSQIYLNPIEAYEFYSKNKWAIERLGKIRQKLPEYEYMFRDSQFQLIDLSAVKHSEFSCQKKVSPNGFLSDEICQLSWYSGIADNANVIAITGFYMNDGDPSSSAALYSQCVWHVIDGIRCRYNEFPDEENKNFQTYIVKVPDHTIDFLFIKSKSNRWWLKLSDVEQNFYCACSKRHYEQALRGNIPDIWLMF